MPEIPLRNLAGDDIGTVSLSDEVFGAPVNDALVHQAVVRHMANRRQGTHKTKTRGEVSGGGAKPWRQKGTGRARQGSRVSPLWRGGGTVFGPTPRTYRQDMPKKMRRKALRSGLSSRLAGGAVIMLDEFVLPQPATREMASSLRSLGVTGDVLVVDSAFEPNARLSVRNLRNVEIKEAQNLNLVDVLEPEHLVFTKAALEALERRLAGEAR